MKKTIKIIDENSVIIYASFVFLIRSICLFIDSSQEQILSNDIYVSVLSDYIYYISDAFLMAFIGVFLYSKSIKKIASLFSLLYIIFLSTCQIIDEIFCMINFSSDKNWIVYMPFLIKLSLFMEIYISIFKKRYDWKMLKSVDYDPGKVQAIYSKPEKVLQLLGAVFSFSPKCSVRYTFAGKTIRFKKNTSFPVLEDWVLKKGEIIENTVFSGDHFFERWEEIKDKKYNILKFNCRRLLK